MSDGGRRGQKRAGSGSVYNFVNDYSSDGSDSESLPDVQLTVTADPAARAAEQSRYAKQRKKELHEELDSMALEQNITLERFIESARRLKRELLQKARNAKTRSEVKLDVDPIFTPLLNSIPAGYFPQAGIRSTFLNPELAKQHFRRRAALRAGLYGDSAVSEMEHALESHIDDLEAELLEGFREANMIAWSKPA